jgi:hypothetical protein
MTEQLCALPYIVVPALNAPLWRQVFLFLQFDFPFLVTIYSVENSGKWPHLPHRSKANGKTNGKDWDGDQMPVRKARKAFGWS